MREPATNIVNGALLNGSRQSVEELAHGSRSGFT
jgi:hypothetical protein